MITRRSLLEAAGTSAMLAGAGYAFTQSIAEAAEGLNLPPQLPEGTRAEAVLDALHLPALGMIQKDRQNAD